MCVCVCVCVCFFGIYMLKNCCWEMILKVQNDVWILSWVACLIAFISVFFPSWKTVFKQSRQLLDTSSTPGYLSSSWAFSYHNLDRSSIAGGSIKKVPGPSITGGSIELLFLCLCFVPRHFLDSCICRCCFSRHLYLSRITEDLYICSSRSDSHFLNLSRSIRTYSSPKHSLLHI